MKTRVVRSVSDGNKSEPCGSFFCFAKKCRSNSGIVVGISTESIRMGRKRGRKSGGAERPCVGTEKELSRLNKKVNALAEMFERAHFLDYVQYVSDEKRMLRRAFLTGLLRGVGTAVGVTVLGAVIIYLLHALAKSNLPYIADFISDIIDIIEKTRK